MSEREKALVEAVMLHKEIVASKQERFAKFAANRAISRDTNFRRKSD